jgi:hypothetical protein
MTSELPSAVPEIPVRDINDAVLYHQDCLGFTLKKLTKDFLASDRSAMFHDTASRAYRLPRS